MTVADHASPAYRRWIVCRVFGRRECPRALRVTWCEAHMRPGARNGEHWGAWQLGHAERARYGHGPGMWQQTRAAYALFLDRGWGPWSCA